MVMGEVSEDITTVYRNSWDEFSECSSQTESLINWCVENHAILSHNDNDDDNDYYIELTINEVMYKFSDDWMEVWWFMAGWDCNDRSKKNPKFELSFDGDDTVFLTVHKKKHEICQDEAIHLVKCWMRGYEANCEN